MKSYKILFLTTLVTGTMIAISAYSWFSMWMGLEINLLSIIPLLSDSQNLYPSEASLKYFITQALASNILLFSIIMSMNMNEFIPQDSNIWLMMIMNSALCIKMGAAPFHAWFPEVVEGLSWMNCLLMLTWQKIAPMILLMYNSKMTLFLSFIIITSTLISGLMGINQVSLRKILAYSSINHIAWMIASMLMQESIWSIYFLIYSLITLNIILILNNLKIYYLKQFFSKINFNKSLKFFFILNFLSLGGLPPFLGFFPKWLTVNTMIQNNFFFLSLTLITFTLMTLFFYLRITFSTMVINAMESIVYTEKSIANYMTMIINFLALTGLIMCTLIFNIY